MIDEQKLSEIFGPAYGALIRQWMHRVQSPTWVEKQLLTLLDGYPTDTSSAAFQQADRLNDEGWSCHERGRYHDALSYYTRALSLCSDFPMVWNNQGLAHFRLGAFEPAKEAYLEAIHITPGFIKPWSNMGILYWELQHNRDEAMLWFRRALALDPAYHRAQQYLATLERHVMTIDEVLDAVFGVLASVPNAAALGTREIHFQEPYGVVVHAVRSAFIPTTSPNDGLLISRTRAVTPARSAQVEGGVAYTKLQGLDRAAQPHGVERMFMLHLHPSDGIRVGIVKVAGWIYHFTASGQQETIEEHLVSRPEFDIHTPGGAIVISGVGFDERFTRLHIVKEAVYEPLVVPHLCTLAREDLQHTPIYRL